MKEFLKRFLIGSLAVLVLAGSQTTQVFARNKTVQWMAQKLTEMSLIVQDASVLDWDDEDGALIILGHSDPDRVVFFEPDLPHKEGQRVVVIDPTIKSDDSRIQKVMFGGGNPGAHGYITVTVIGTERVMKVCLDTPDIYILRHDSGTGVFERTEKEGPETKKWYCLYAKDKVRACEAPQTGEINEYKASEGKWDITVPFAEGNKVLFGGSAILYDWNDHEIASSKYKAGDSGVTFSGTDFTNIIPGYTYYVQAVPDEGLDCDSEGFVYRSVTQPGEKMPFALGCMGSDPVDSDNVISGFEINYGYKEDNSGYMPALKWNGKIVSDNSLLIKPKNTVSDWILKTRDAGASVSVTVDSADAGAQVAIDNSASNAVSRITKKSGNVRMNHAGDTLLAKSADKEYLAIKYNEDLKQVLSATVEERTQNTLKFKFVSSGEGENALEVPAIATLRDGNGQELKKELTVGSTGVDFGGLEAGQRYLLSLKIDNSEKYMPEGCNGIISNKGENRILYAVELDKPIEAATVPDGVTGVTENVLDSGNIHITNSSGYKIRYVISESDKWKDGDPYVSTGTVGYGKQYTDTKIVKKDEQKIYFIYYKYDDEESGVTSDYTTGKELIVEAIQTLKANWKADISGLVETAGNDKYIRNALKDSANVLIVETNVEYRDAQPIVYVTEESKYTGDDALMVSENKIGYSTEFVPGTYVAIVGLDLSDEAAAEKGFKVIHKSETKKFTVYAGKVENVNVYVDPNGNIRIENKNNYKIDYKIVSSPSWKEGDAEDSGGSVDRNSEHTDTSIIKTDKGKTYYIFFKYNDKEKNAVSKEWTRYPYDVYVGNLKTIRANWKTDISKFDETYSEDEESLRKKLLSSGEAIIAETGEVYGKAGVNVYVVNKNDYTTDEALMTEANKIKGTTNFNAGTYVAIVGIDKTDEEAAKEGYRVVRKSVTKEFTVKPAKLTLAILPETKTVWNKTQDVKKTDWNVGVQEDEALAADPSSFKLMYSKASKSDTSGEITDEVMHFEEEAEYRLTLAPVDPDKGYVIKNGERILDNSNYTIIDSFDAILYVSDIEDGSSLEARKNTYTDKLYYDDLKNFKSNEELKTYLDVYVDNERKLDASDYKLVVDDSTSGNITDLSADHKKVGASFTVSVHPNVEDLPVQDEKNKITLTVKKQPIMITATEPEKLSHFVGDNPVNKYNGTISVNKIDIDGNKGGDITGLYGSSIASWAVSDAASVDPGYIDMNRPGKYKIRLKDITDDKNDIALKPSIDENYSLVSAEGDYTVETAVTVSLYDVATGKKLAPNQIVPSGNSDIIFETTEKGEATTYTQWFIRDCDGEGEKLSWPSKLGFIMESYNNTGLKIQRIGEDATAFSGNLVIFGRFPSDTKKGEEGEFYASDIDPVIYNGNGFVAEGDSKYLDRNGQVKKGYTDQLGITVYYGDNLLSYGTDYTLSYKNNVNAAKADAGKKAPTVTVKGIGAYKGKSVVKTFTILPAELSCLGKLKLDKEYLRYNGKEMSTIVKGNVFYTVGSKEGKKFAKNSYTYRIYDMNGVEVSNTVMPKDSAYGVYRVVAIASGRDANFTGETEEVKVNVLPASANGKFKIKGVKKTVNYTAKGVDYTDFLDAAKFQVTAGKLLITDINDPRITIDIVEDPSEEAFAIKTLSNSGSYYLRFKPSQFDTFAVEKIYEPAYVKINFKGTAVKSLVQLKTKKHTWNGSNHNIELKISNKATDPNDILLYREPLEKDSLGTRMEQYIGTLAEFADNRVIPGGALDNSVSGTYVIKIIGVGSCYGKDSVKYTVESTKYNKKSVTAYINTAKEQKDIELSFNRAGYSDDLVKVYWQDPSNKNAEPLLLTLNKDYTLIWGKNDQVGKDKGSVTIVGKNTYFSNSFKKTFTINRTDISKVIYERSLSSALLGSKTANPYLYQTKEFAHEDMPVKALLAEGVDYKVTNIVENPGSKTATATIDASDSKYFCGTISQITYDLYPVEVTDVELILDRSTVLLVDDYVYNTSYDDFGNKYLDNFVEGEGNIKIASAKITFKDNKSVILSGDEIGDNFIIGYANADKTGNTARVMVRFKDGKKYPTSQVYYSKEYTIMVKQ